MANGQQDPRDLDEVWNNFMEARTKLLQSMLDFVHAAGRLAPSTDAGVEAAADFFTSHLSMLGSASSFIDTGRAKDLARGMLDAARKAINRPATSQIQRTSMGLSGHMEYRHTMK